MASGNGLPRRPVVNRLAEGLDERFTMASSVRKESTHVFPKHFSFLWGEIALYSFVVLILSGTVLALFFVPDTTDTVYYGSYEPLRGIHMSRAYASAIDLSFEVRGGLFIRQVHHWAALIFVAGIVLHMIRNFFTGAFRKPRELTWVTGVIMLLLAIPEGYMGYGMLDDLLSGMGVRIVSGLLLSIPVAGTWVHWAVFGGEFEGEVWISRFFLAHVFIIPALLAALIAVHLAFVWYQKHTQFPGPGRYESNVKGDRAMPGFFSKTIANGVCVFGVIGLLGGLFQINPIWLWGPYVASNSSMNAQPDWYAGFFIGALRLFPRWEIDLWGGYYIPAAFWPGLFIPLLMFILLAIYPFVEQRVTKDRRRHHLLQRPRDAPVRSGVGAMALTFYLVLTIAGADDVIAVMFNIPYEVLRWGERAAIILLPPLAYMATVRVCRGLQRADRDVLERGVRTGVLEMSPDGNSFTELRQPPGGVDHEGRPVPLAYGGARVDRSVAVPQEGADEHGSDGHG